MMFPSAVRRVVSTQQAPAISSLASAISRPAASFSLSGRSNRHQRRWSSSKPSSPDNGNNNDPDPSVAASSSQPIKSSGRKRKSKAAQVSTQKLPSVPSTQHLPLDTLALSSFFSQHRPISITHSLPKPVSPEAFASIFSGKSRSPKSAEVISTLSRAVKSLDAPMARLAVQEGEPDPNEMHKIDITNVAGEDSSLYVQLNAMSGVFLPFRPPPLPTPQAESDAAETGAKSATEESEEVQLRSYKAVITIAERMDSDGQIKVIAHSPYYVEDPPTPRSFLERMALRHLKFEEAQRQRDRMMAISVRRQKKLKMKKKKHKKLMRRTRHERRKLDRT